MKPQGIILAFHQISNRFLPGINNIRPARFWTLLDMLETWGVAFRDFDIGAEKTTLTLTFDDGYADQFEILQRLSQNGIRLMIFIPSAYVGQKNSWEYSSGMFPCFHLDAAQIRRLAEAGAVIGSHGVSHRSLTALKPMEAKQELAESKARLEDITGQAIKCLSFPFGRTSRSVNEIARNCGYEQGYVLQDMPHGGEGEGFLRCRWPVYGIDDYYSLKSIFRGVQGLERFKRRVINDLAAGTIIVSRKLK